MQTRISRTSALAPARTGPCAQLARSRNVSVRAGDDEETKLQVAGYLKSGVRFVAGAIETLTDLVYNVVPDSVSKSNVKLGVQVLTAIFIFSVASNVLSFAVTLGSIALAAFVAINVLKLDVNEILNAAKTKQ